MNNLISRTELLKAVDKIIGDCASYKAWAIRNAISVAPAIREEDNGKETDRRKAQSKPEV